MIQIFFENLNLDLGINQFITTPKLGICYFMQMALTFRRLAKAMTVGCAIPCGWEKGSVVMGGSVGKQQHALYCILCVIISEACVAGGMYG